MFRYLIAAFGLGAAAAGVVSTPALAESNPAPVVPAAHAAARAANDYSLPESWLCRPGRDDACRVNLETTVVRADGSTSHETWAPDPDAPIDCFYVYPTISTDPGPNSDMLAGPEEKAVVAAQFARFGSQCRVYAPLYRQVTLTALRQLMAGEQVPIDGELAYGDVLAAWKHYLENDNQGRGFVLIGHSQGARMLSRLVAEEIDAKPVQHRLVSALLIGWNIAIPRGEDVGGTFQRIPLCRSASQTGCLIAYASFRDDVPPPPDSRFGRVKQNGMLAACTNPASLEGGRGTLHAYLSNARILDSASSPVPASEAAPIDTPYYSLPGMLTAECVSNEKGTYLQVTVNGDPADPRVDDIGGDVVMEGQVVPAWGLHLIDMHLAMGNLIGIVGQQSKAFLATSKR